MIAAPAVFVLVHAAAPAPGLVLLASCLGWPETLPNARVGPFHSYFRLLGLREVGLEISFHGFCCDVVFLLFDEGFVGQSVDGASYLFL